MSRECLYCGDMKMPCHDVSAFPFKSRKKALREESFVVCVISVRSGEQPDKTYLIRRRPAKGLLAGLWEFPSVQVNSKACQSRSARRRLLAEFLKGANKEVYDILQKKSFQKSKGYIEHLFSHIRATYFVEYCECQGVTSLTM
jgi:A/G-specific adenine glycosylase